MIFDKLPEELLLNIFEILDIKCCNCNKKIAIIKIISNNLIQNNSFIYCNINCSTDFFLQ